MKLTKKEIIEKYSSKFEDKDEQIAVSFIRNQPDWKDHG